VYSSPKIILLVLSRRMKLKGHENKRDALKIRVGHFKGKKWRVRPRRTREDNIKTGLKGKYLKIWTKFK